MIFKIIKDMFGSAIGTLAKKSPTIGAGKARALAREEVQRVRQAKDVLAERPDLKAVRIVGIR